MIRSILGLPYPCASVGKHPLRSERRKANSKQVWKIEWLQKKENPTLVVEISMAGLKNSRKLVKRRVQLSNISLSVDTEMWIEREGSLVKVIAEPADKA